MFGRERMGFLQSAARPMPFSFISLNIASIVSVVDACTFDAILEIGFNSCAMFIGAPYWVSYSEMVRQAGAIPVLCEAGEEHHFKINNINILHNIGL